jgi:hypothetical protein
MGGDRKTFHPNFDAILLLIDEEQPGTNVCGGV